MENQIKPNKTAFIVLRIFTKILFMFILFIIFFIFLKFIAPELSVGIFLFSFFAILSFGIYALENPTKPIQQGHHGSWDNRYRYTHTQPIIVMYLPTFCVI